jgi:hypothetical protein
MVGVGEGIGRQGGVIHSGLPLNRDAAAQLTVDRRLCR